MIRIVFGKEKNFGNRGGSDRKDNIKMDAIEMVLIGLYLSRSEQGREIKLCKNKG
jgi:hypothetical protein